MGVCGLLLEFMFLNMYSKKDKRSPCIKFSLVKNLYYFQFVISRILCDHKLPSFRDVKLERILNRFTTFLEKLIRS